MADGAPGFARSLPLEQVWSRVHARVTPLEWETHRPLIEEIRRLKAERGAVILAHNSMTPEIFHGVGD